METKIPNLDSLVSGIAEPAKGKPSETATEDNTMETPGRNSIDATMDSNPLWEEFMSLLEASKDNSGTPQKIYKIDADIIETVAQCDFRGRSVSQVLNCILRTFLIANIGSLDNLRRHSPSLFDKYLTK